MPRQCAINVLINVICKKKNISASIEPFKDHTKRALISEFSYGVCRYYYTLYPLLNLLVDKPLKAKDKDIELAIILGLYQLKFMHLKPFAVVDETVKLAKKFNKSWARGLINALLRRYIREADVLEAKLIDNEPYQLAHPQWFIDKLKLNKLSFTDICKNNNKKALICLRINTAKVSINDYLGLLNDRDIQASACEYLSNAIILETKVDVADLPFFDKGFVFVQDIAAQFARTLLELGNGQRILDACSAPGGKLTDILQSPFSFKKVIALDNSANRVKRINENLIRLSQEASVIVGDAMDPSKWWDGIPFNRILLDAPCSATGVIRRHPDIKLLRTQSDITEIVKRQKEILEALWQTLAPGGRLVYATCSIFPEENEQQIESFIAGKTDVKVIDFSLPIGMSRTIGWQLYPGESDGFYYAVLEKNS